MVKYGFCHGWMIDAMFNEVTCKRRERCKYYQEDFYRRYGDRLDEFEEMFPDEPCRFFVDREDEAATPLQHSEQIATIFEGYER
jgi:hypothetical protein